jgi:hypothetical protein
MFLTSFFVALILVLLVWYRIKTSRRDYLLSRIPSPKKNLIFHNALEVLGLDLNGIFKKFESWYHELGDVFHVTFHQFDCGTVFIADHKIADVLSLSAPDRTRSIMYKPLARWIGNDGFFLSSGNRLKTRMKMIANAFSPRFSQKVEVEFVIENMLFNLLFFIVHGNRKSSLQRMCR